MMFEVELLANGTYAKVYKCESLPDIVIKVVPVHVAKIELEICKSIREQNVDLSNILMQKDITKSTLLKGIAEYIPDYKPQIDSLLSSTFMDFTLHDFIHLAYYDDATVSHTFEELTKGLAFVHGAKIAHMDLYPRNVLMKAVTEPIDGYERIKGHEYVHNSKTMNTKIGATRVRVTSVKICDYGYSMSRTRNIFPKTNLDSTFQFLISPTICRIFRPPEMYKLPMSLGNPEECLERSIDVWSLGSKFIFQFSGKILLNLEFFCKILCVNTTYWHSTEAPSREHVRKARCHCRLPMTSGD